MRRRLDRTARRSLALPWWVILLMSPVAYAVIAHGLPLTLRGPLGQAFVGAARILGAFTSAALLVVTAIVFLHQRHARQLLDRQTGLESIRSLTWQEFERLVAEAYRQRGYSVVENGGGGADGGVDLILDKDGTVLVQCKQWRASLVGVKEVRELFGILAAEKARCAILVTAGRFSEDARAFADGKPLELIDGTGLLTLIRPPTNSPTAAPRPEPPTPPGCPLCGHDMVLRTAKQGPRAGSRFWGCSKYPGCRGTVTI